MKIRVQRNVDGVNWRTEVVNDLHAGHLQLDRDTIRSLPSARRHLSANENTKERVKELHSSGVELGALWSTLRDKHQWIQYKDVDNAVQTLKKEQCGGLTEIEALHKKLKSEGVVSESLRDECNRVF